MTEERVLTTNTISTIHEEMEKIIQYLELHQQQERVTEEQYREEYEDIFYNFPKN